MFLRYIQRVLRKLGGKTKTNNTYGDCGDWSFVVVVVAAAVAAGHRGGLAAVCLAQAGCFAFRSPCFL